MPADVVAEVPGSASAAARVPRPASVSIKRVPGKRTKAAKVAGGDDASWG